MAGVMPKCFPSIHIVLRFCGDTGWRTRATTICRPCVLGGDTELKKSESSHSGLGSVCQLRYIFFAPVPPWCGAGLSYLLRFFVYRFGRFFWFLLIKEFVGFLFKFFFYSFPITSLSQSCFACFFIVCI